MADYELPVEPPDEGTELYPPAPGTNAMFNLIKRTVYLLNNEFTAEDAREDQEFARLLWKMWRIWKRDLQADVRVVE
jgi:hypothetical protein